MFTYDDWVVFNFPPLTETHKLKKKKKEFKCLFGRDSTY